ncbi:MAG: hypothetical protein H0U87_08600 [Acidobacteria bacterium]|jgi:hypothetical protein|nr:hypothetical protein [Acidobacteriota bacterium]
MSEQIQIQNLEAKEAEDLPVIDGELLEETRDKDVDGEIENQKTEVESQKSKIEIAGKKQSSNDIKGNQKSFVQYIFLPAIFLFVALLGGLRVAAETNDFLFLKPALVCLIFAAVSLVLFFRARLINLGGWFSERSSPLKNAANGAVMLALFFASVQIFNSLLPERGLPFWTIGFCFFWTLWNNLFGEFDARRLIKSLGAMFALAFLVKYLILANLAAPPSESLWQRVTENPTREAFTWLLDLPRFAPATGYLQFFALVFYLLGLFLIEPQRETKNE